MKIKLKIFGLLLVSALSYAQTGGLSAGENYIYTKTCLNEDCSRKTEAVEYSDGLGRSRQVIGIKSSPNGKDVVTPLEYDAFGRQVRSYLPIPQPGTQNGALYADPKAAASQTYGSDPYFYSESVTESSPAARILSGTKPGADYHGYSVSYGYEMNASGEVKKYTVTTSWANGATDNTFTVSGNYNAGELVKTSVTDEDGHKTTEFKNGKGQTLLVRKENADTYYIYNKYGHLVYVIPPLAASQALTATLLNDLCYQYRYDSRGRQVEKKLPGKGWEYTVYDRQDRVLMTQDANMGLLKQWLFTKYDKLGRAAYTGIFTSAQNYGSEGRQAEQAQANNAAAPQNESRDAGGFSANGVTAYYTNAVYPTAFTKILSIHYFDSYPSGSPARPSQIFSKNTIGDNMAGAVNTKNLPTASYVKNIEDDNWTKSYIWYDEQARAVGTYAVNHLGGFTRTESALDFAGAVQQTRVTHARLASDTPRVITQTFEYDARNRLKKQWHQVDNRPQELLSENIYNDLSQLTGKKVGNNLQEVSYSYNIRGSVTKVNDPAALGTDLFAYSLDYYVPATSAAGKYSGNVAVNSWKTSQDQVLRSYTYRYDNLNRLTMGIYSEPNASVPQNNFYNETAAYDLGGNITSLQRTGNSFASTAALIDNLTYIYNGNRLNTVTDTSGNYTGYPDVSGNPLSYDDNGNMTSHTDKGILEIGYNILDLPDYVKFNRSYVPRSTGMGVDYNVNTRYLYRADGTRMKKIYTYGTGKANLESSTVTDYLDGFQYVENDNGSLSGPVLKFVPTSEGYYDFEKNSYIYSYTDHLGNIRLSYFKNAGGSAEVLEKNDYYPFGLNHNFNVLAVANPAYKYQYNGKELQEETGWSDYGARMYMADIGRWGVLDPLAETSRRFNPYNYAYNNPISFIDPDGRKAVAPGSYEALQPMNGALGYLSGGGSAVFGSFTEFLGQGNPFSQLGNMDGKGAGGGSGTFGETQWYKDIMAYLGTSEADFSKFDFMKYGNDSPDDIIIRNKKGHIMYRIISDIKKDVYIDTDIEINNPITINLNKYKKMGADAVGFSSDYSATLGGGPNGGFAFVYFISGSDAGNGYLYGYTGGNTGFEASVGLSKFYSKYVDSDKKNFNAAGYAGKSSGRAFGVGIWGYSKSWGNRTNDGELWQGQKSKTTWVTISSGAALGEMGAKVFWSNYTILKQLF